MPDNYLEIILDGLASLVLLLTPVIFLIMSFFPDIPTSTYARLGAFWAICVVCEIKVCMCEKRKE